MRIERINSTDIKHRNLKNNTNNTKMVSNYTNPTFQRLVIGDKGRKLLVVGGSMFYAAGLSMLSYLGIALAAIPTLALMLGAAKWAASAPKEAQGFIHNLPDKKTKNVTKEVKENEKV